VVAALQSAPTGDELAGEAAAVEAMTSALADAQRGATPVTARKPLSKPLRRIVGLTAIGVLGVGGLAAAAKGVFVPDNRPSAEKSHDTDADEDETTESESTVSETTAVDTTDVDTTAVDSTDDEDSADKAADSTAPGDTGPTTSIECADGNHGKTVSSVAHSVPPGPGHGEAVSAAAQSDCGKGDTTSSVDTTQPSDTTVAGIAPNGEGNGNGNGQDHKPSDPGSQGIGHKPVDPGAGHGPPTTNGG
jgi:hypothetical protein